MEIQANDRVLLAGKTGSGKTYFAGKLLGGVARLVVIDPKGNLTQWGLTEPSKAEWSHFGKGAGGRFRIVPPITDDPEAWYEGLFNELYDIGGLVVYIDEAYAVTSPNSRPGKWLSALYTRGREKGIGVWAATQRPTWIPLFLISEADWIIMFRLNLEADRQKIAKIAGDEVLDRIADPHGFWLYNVQYEEPKYYKTAVKKGQK
jgi:DNA helicase HerA-like ATPase